MTSEPGLDQRRRAEMGAAVDDATVAAANADTAASATNADTAATTTAAAATAPATAAATAAGAAASAATTAAATTAATAIRLEHVAVEFHSGGKRITALRDVDLEVPAGQFVSIVGPSGCGKSTLLKLVAGLLPPTSGSVRLHGEPVSGPRRDIGYVFQRAALLEWRSVRRNILLQAEMRGMPKGPARERADELIALTGLTGFEDALPHELSGGMQQRVALCRALLHRPPVLLMDEPFGALDALTRERMNLELHRIWRETGTTVLLVTHSIAESVFLGNRVVAMSARPGTVVEVIDVPLGDERDYGRTLADPAFTSAASHIRELLGAAAAAE